MAAKKASKTLYVRLDPEILIRFEAYRRTLDGEINESMAARMLMRKGLDAIEKLRQAR